MKVCIKCGSTKPCDEFHRDNLRPDGRFPYCKKCRSVPRKPIKCRSAEEVLSNYIVLGNGCWEWQGTLDINNYGVACFNGKRQKAHRLSFSHFKSAIMDGLIICHTCDNPSCINPDHLYQGTNQDNSNDMIARSRHNPVRGEKSGLAILTAEQVLSIRSDTRRHKLIAIDYGIAPSTVSSIKTRRNWAHI